MATEDLTIWSAQLLSAPTSPAPVAGVPFDLAISPEFENGPTPRNSLLLNLEYTEITPDITNGTPSFSIGVVVETKGTDGRWYPIAYQFSPYRNSESPAKRTIRVQPDISDFNTGIDDSVYPVDREIARISRQQGKLPVALFRMRVIAVDYDPAGVNHLVSVKLSASGERYDAV